MSSGSGIDSRRYRRRILGLGALLFVLCFVIPAPFVVGSVENDLENRSRERLAEAGVTGASIRFSGQDGTVACTAALDDPEAVAADLSDVWGVRQITVEDSCRASEGSDGAGGLDGDADATTVPEGADPDDSTVPDPSEPAASTPAPTTPATTVAPIGSIASLVAEDPQFSQLAGLFAGADLDVDLATDSPFTLLAPDDDAFDRAFEAIGPDAFAELVADPAFVEELLLHHLTPAALTRAELEPGSLEMLDGDAVTVDLGPDDLLLFSSGPSVAQLVADQDEVIASNGVIHAIDAVLLPEAVDDDAEAETPDIAASFATGRMVLDGSVASEGQRAALIEPLNGVIDPANIEDRLVVDESAAMTDEDVNRLAALVQALPVELAEGVASLTGSDVAVRGVHLGVDSVDRMAALAEANGASLDLSPRPVADEALAAALGDELNAIVADEPVTFEPNSAAITPESAAVLDRVAATAQSVEAIALLVVGHTDSDGQATTNLALSEQRAAAVVEALAERGLDPESLTSEGRGDTEPVVVDGVEDKAASRRVEFVASAVTDDR